MRGAFSLMAQVRERVPGAGKSISITIRRGRGLGGGELNWSKLRKELLSSGKLFKVFRKYSAAQQAYHRSSQSRYSSVPINSSRQTNFPAVRFVHFGGAEHPGPISALSTRSIASFREPNLQRGAGTIIRILAQLFGKSRRNGAIISIKIDGTMRPSRRLMMRRAVMSGWLFRQERVSGFWWLLVGFWDKKGDRAKQIGAHKSRPAGSRDKRIYK